MMSTFPKRFGNKRVIWLIVVALVLAGGLCKHKFPSWTASTRWSTAKHAKPPGRPSHYDPSKLHLLVPATSTNHHLCHLLTSAAILGYPAPVLINWGAPEHADDYAQHLIKIEGVLNYTRALIGDRPDELLFMIDGYDAWFQLPADILIKRYYDTVEKASRYNREVYGADNVKHLEIRDTILFGPDKLCWPGDEKVRAACWALPDAWLPLRAFGPDTDHGIVEHRRARWLNSGTIMGTVREVHDVFAASLQKIREDHSTDSDQFYFAEVYAEQSYRRLLTKIEHERSLGRDVAGIEAALADERKVIPQIGHGQRSEYFIGLDLDSDMWQTVAYYEDYITWVQHNLSSHYVTDVSRTTNPYHHFLLPEDLQAGSPLTVASSPDDPEDLNEGLSDALFSWGSLPLVTNVVTKTVPAVVHFTGKKPYRDMWWPRNWFYEHQAAMLHRLRRRGVRREGDVRDALAGAWTRWQDDAGWVDWDGGLCGQYEDQLQGADLDS